jgi:MoaA/NifB/PqqE/SkfB family radical SAM enzyme
MTMTGLRPVEAGSDVGLRSLELDLTRACQAKCDHCYNSSGPNGSQGDMTREDWLAVLDQAAAMGVKQVQLIGGEPTLHPHLGELVNHAVDLGLQVEVFSNLIHVRPSLWPLLRQRGVTLATSYYSDRATEHEQITHHRGSYARTKAHIEQALRYRIPLRAGIIHVLDGQRVEQAVAELRQLGVSRVRVDRQRGIGRAAEDATVHDMNELCGKCARGRAAVLPDGSVGGCVMAAGMMTAGNVRTTPLSEIVTSPGWAALAAAIPHPRSIPRDECLPTDPCVPEFACLPAGCSPDSDGCQPHIPEPVPQGAGGPATRTATACNPDQDGSDCAPAETEACGPSYDD